MAKSVFWFYVRSRDVLHERFYGAFETQWPCDLFFKLRWPATVVVISDVRQHHRLSARNMIVLTTLI